ncbi:hypothetical protein BGX34_011536 [Mortierella sp. NVP85]|nr:hypothetical protein BGX34_011536 [Mortierella sp. NVP85]
MAPLLNAKEWFKKRGKKKKAPSPTNVYVPGIGYPPARNSSQPTLIPYPRSPKSQGHSDSDLDLELDEDGLPEFILCLDSVGSPTSASPTSVSSPSHPLNGPSTACTSSSTTNPTVPPLTDVPDEGDSSHGLLAGSGSSSSSRNSRNSVSGTGSDSAATLVSSSIPCDPPKPFTLGFKYNMHSGSHSSLPAQLPGQPTTELATTPPSNLEQKIPGQAQSGQIRHSLTRNLNYLNNRHKRNSEQTWSQAQIQSMPQPEISQPLVQKPSNTLTSMPAQLTSAESLDVSHSKAQEYARTVKTLWQMVEDKDLAHRLKDATPVEREWLILNHKNALFPLKPSTTTTSPTAAVPDVQTGREIPRARSNGVSNPRLAPIDETDRVPASQQTKPTESTSRQPPSFQHRRGCHLSKDGAPHHGAQEQAPEMCSLPNSPAAGPVNSASEDAKKARRSTLLSPMVMQSAIELQKRDHYTIQQRVDMEEDWRMQAKLLKSVTDQEERARGVRRVLLQRQLQQRRAEGFKEYEPTHQDFNKWYDLKEELDDNEVPDLNDDVRGFDLKEEYEYEDERMEREARETEERKKKELEELEHELNILGLDRFDGLASFVEPGSRPDASADQEVPSSQTQSSEELEEHRQRQMLLHQQLQEQYRQLQLQLQNSKAEIKPKAKVPKKKPTPAPAGASPPAPPPPPPLAARPVNAPNMVVLPLKPRNGRKMFSNDCDSMIIKDMPIVAPPTR